MRHKTVTRDCGGASVSHRVMRRTITRAPHAVARPRPYYANKCESLTGPWPPRATRQAEAPPFSQVTGTVTVNSISAKMGFSFRASEFFLSIEHI